VFLSLPALLPVQAIQNQRKTFVRGSKSFSDTLKQYFKEGRWVGGLPPVSRCHRPDPPHQQPTRCAGFRADVLFRAAHRLIDQTNSLLRTIKDALEQ
jgi:programmed cell death protein 10